MQASRQAAIQTLHQRREEKKRERERLAQEEIVSDITRISFTSAESSLSPSLSSPLSKVLLQASGKIKRCEKQMKKKRKREERVVPSSKQLASEQVTDPPSQTVPDSVITEFFEVRERIHCYLTLVLMDHAKLLLPPSLVGW